MSFAIDDEITPSQKLTATAFALKAEKSNGVADGGVTTAMIANGTIHTDKAADNAVISPWETITRNISWMSGATGSN